jgi:hypothetical protein
MAFTRMAYEKNTQQNIKFKNIVLFSMRNLGVFNVKVINIILEIR